ncbi:TadE/TadG family type IV pilus assembly protein [Puniceibacterium confluentis]|uniref:TadE/TadG family type IV pilus assembly protein n=1 Tax=Puniceibacterium confluentis TaxID=1958944 RepID=UPI0016477223|nr:TadE family protein [Puniceibacterium confluentis]
MKRFNNNLKNLGQDFALDEDGSSTIEFVIWTPLIVTAIMLIIDFSYSLTLNASMWNASRETARALSRHTISADEGEMYLRNAMFFTDKPYEIGIDLTRDDVFVKVSLPVGEAAMTPFLSRYMPGSLSAKVSMLREPV